MEGQMKCNNCGQPLKPDDKFCSNCGKPFEAASFSQTPAPEPASAGPDSAQKPAEIKSIPWEQREKYGFFGGLWKTWAESLFHPESFFQNVPDKGGITAPLLYCVITAWIGLAIQEIYGMVFSSLWIDWLSKFAEIPDLWFIKPLTGIMAFLNIVMMPVFIIIGLFIISGIYHLLLKIFGWGKREFEATFRAIAYSSAAALFYILPFCGGLLVLIWSFVLGIIGIKNLQQTTGGKSATVVFLPLIFLMCCLIMGILLFGAAIMGLIGASNPGAWD